MRYVMHYTYTPTPTPSPTLSHKHTYIYNHQADVLYICYIYIRPQGACILLRWAVRADEIEVRLPEQASRRYRERLQFYTDCAEPAARRRGQNERFHALAYLDIIERIRRLCDGCTGS